MKNRTFTILCLVLIATLASAQVENLHNTTPNTASNPYDTSHNNTLSVIIIGIIIVAIVLYVLFGGKKKKDNKILPFSKRKR